MVPGKIDGITLTGGEPFEQPEALSELLDRIDGWRREESLDILCYSGMPVRHLITKHKAIVDRLDALIPEEFRDDLPTEAVLLSELAQRRYHEPSGQRPRMQVALGKKDLWMIGIPRRGDLQRLQELSNKHGLQLEEASWL
jgi:anaerobic ribonucleoside-triphosphate reductase activating protein